MNNTASLFLRLSRLAGAAVIAAMLLATSAHAHQFLYRGMRIDPAIPAQPITPPPPIALGLNVRPVDVGNPGPNVLVTPNDAAGNPQGMSVIWSNNDGDACQLPAFSRPAGGTWNGNGNAITVKVWRLDLNAHPLPGTMAVAAAPIIGPPAAPQHALVTTVGAGMTLVNFQAAITATAANWVIVPAPPVACP